MTNNKDMDYKELYNKALEKAKFYYNNCPLNPEKNKLEDMFPALKALKESEDERIRKSLIELVNWAKINIDAPIEVSDAEKALSYLEKRKEQKPIPKFKVGDRIYDKSDSYNRNVIREVGKDYYINAFAQKMDMAYTDANFEFLEHLDNDPVVSKPAEMRDSRQIALMIENGRRSGVTEGRKQVIDYPEEYGLCKPVEWSEEDKQMLLSIINAFRNGTVSTIGQEQWLKSLPKKFNLQPKAEWSEEDEGLLERAISIIGWAGSCTDKYKIINPDGAAELQKFLKSLRPRQKQEWSEEDKSILNNIIAYKYLNIDDLEWLKALPQRFNLQPKQEWSEEDDAAHTRILGAVAKAFMGVLPTKPSEEDVHWLKTLPERFNLQSKVEWGEDERIVLDSIIDDYEKAGKSFCGYDGKIMLLKAIRDGEYDLPKQEWSKEDDKMLKSIIEDSQNCHILGVDQIDWIKSLRPTALTDTIKEVTKDKETAMKFLQSAGIADENGQLAEMYRTPAEQDDENLDTLDFIVGYLKYKGHEDDADWLNSIRRHFWKPSKEQMDALQEAYKAYYRGDNTNSNGLKLQMLYKEITEHLL